MKIRYPGAQPFSTDQKPIFFGREQELDELRRFVNAEQLVVLYAKSGLGKSSLLNAGLIPQVEAEGRLQPLSIRFGAHTADSKATPLGSSMEAIRHGVKGTNQALEKIKPKGEDSLWYHLKNRQLATGEKGYLLVFDQFEELFTYPDEAVRVYGQQLSELLFTTIPDRFRERLEAGLKANPAFLTEAEMQQLHQPFELRVVTAIRSDRMSLLNKLKAYLPNILENCYELRSLSIREAESAILSPAYLPKETGPFGSPVFDYEDEAVASLIDFLSEGRTQEIESFQLQILCEYVERQVVLKQGSTLVKQADIANPDLILENYYLDKIDDLPEADRLPARRLIEEGLVFEEEERRLTLYEGQITRSYGIRPELLGKLLDTHLIRSEPSLRGGYTYELSHDTLVAPVLKAKAKRMEEERLEAEREAERSKAMELEELRRKAEEERALREEAEAAKKEVEAQKFQVEAALQVAEEEKLIAHNAQIEAEKQRQQALAAKNEAERQEKQAISAKNEAERQEQIALTAKEEAEKQRALAQKNERWAKARTKLAGAVSVVAIALAIFAFYSNYRAGLARSEADKSAEIARTELKARIDQEVKKYLTAAERMETSGDLDMAREILEGALKLDSANVEVKQRLNKLQ